MSNRGNINVDVSPALKSLKKFKEQLNKRELRGGMSLAINKTLREGRKKAIEVVGNSYNIPKKNLQTIKAEFAGPYKLEGKILADSEPLPLGLFKPKYEWASPMGVTFEVIKGHRGRIKYAFMMPGLKDVLARGYYNPAPIWGFERLPGKKKGKGTSSRGSRDKGRSPNTAKYGITKMVTVSVLGAVNGTKNKGRIENFIERKLSENLKAELQRRVDKLYDDE